MNTNPSRLPLSNPGIIGADLIEAHQAAGNRATRRAARRAAIHTQRADVPGGGRRNRRSAATALTVATAIFGLVAASCGSDSKNIARNGGDSSQTTEHVHEHEEPDDTGAPATTDADRPATTPDTTADTTTQDTTESTPATSDAPVTIPVSGGAIHGIDEAQSGTIQIVSQGSFRDPEVGTYTASGRGSGFFVGEDGLAVTNNHVVTGAATLEVYIGGDLSKSYNAQVVGTSECNDLAVIQVNTSGEVPYFDWFQQDVATGLDVYAAGFPLGDPQFTLTRGIVAKAKAGGDLTGTSSIDHTIEHDAAIKPGNSGGPLLSADGEVVGVNYAGGQLDTGAQYYAISSDLAQSVVQKLTGGDFESLGVNGHAVADEESGITGIWVSGVAAGSPASEVGLVPGDIITSMNGLPVGTDGTFKDYCDVIRTAGDKPIAIEVLRFDTQELLKGEINGSQPLTTTVVFGTEEVATENSVDEAASYTDYVPVTDDTGSLGLEVPAEWAQVDTTPLVLESGESFPRIQAAPDLAAFAASYDVPGVTFVGLPAATYGVDDVLTTFGLPEDCTDGGVFDYDDGAFAGKYQLWQDCGGTGAVYVVVATRANTGDAVATTFLTAVQAVTTADLDAIDHILATFTASI